jgi:hypothetical protein
VSGFTSRNDKWIFLLGLVLENDEAESRFLSSVLHLAQVPPTVFQVEAITARDGEAYLATASIRPYPPETATHSRGPPLM